MELARENRFLLIWLAVVLAIAAGFGLFIALVVGSSFGLEEACNGDAPSGFHWDGWSCHEGGWQKTL